MIENTHAKEAFVTQKSQTRKKKLKEIISMTTPSTVSAFRSFRGCRYYYSTDFIMCSFFSLSELLRYLIKQYDRLGLLEYEVF